MGVKMEGQGSEAKQRQSPDRSVQSTESRRVTAAVERIHWDLDVLLVDPSMRKETLLGIGRREELAMEARGLDMSVDASG